LFKKPALSWKFKKKKTSSPGPVDERAYMVKMSRQSLYFREKLILYLKNLTIDLTAFQQRTAVGEMKAHLKDGTIDLPQELRDLIQTDSISKSGKAYRRFRIPFFNKESISPMDIGPLVDLLEKEMDIRSQNGNK